MKEFKQERYCKLCKEKFIAHNPVKKYCSQECQKLALDERLKKERAEIRAMRIQSGRCVTCDVDLEDKSLLNCKSCRDKANNYYKDLRERKKQVGFSRKARKNVEKKLQLLKEESYKRNNLVFTNDLNLKTIPKLNEGYLYKFRDRIVRIIEDKLVALSELELVELITKVMGDKDEKEEDR